MVDGTDRTDLQPGKKYLLFLWGDFRLEIGVALIGDGGEFPERFRGEVQREQELLQRGKGGFIGGLEVGKCLIINLLFVRFKTHCLESNVGFKFAETGVDELISGGVLGGTFWRAGTFWCACGNGRRRCGRTFFVGGTLWSAGQGRQRAGGEQVATSPAITAGLAVPLNTAGGDRLPDRLAGNPQAACCVGL